jgi:two-component system, LuxR family, sensor kinase FixL
MPTMHGRARVNGNGRVNRADLTRGKLVPEGPARVAVAVAERARSLLESAPDAMVVADGAGRIVLVNSQTEALFGYRRQELLGQPVEILIPAALRQRHLGHRARYAAAPSARPMGLGLELSARRADGSEFPVEISLSTLETVDGLLVLSAIRDITERQAAEQLRQESIELVGHELRNALTSIRGYSQLLQRGGPSSARAANVIERQTRQLDRLVGELLGVTGRGAEQLALQCAEVELAALVRACADQAQELHRSHIVRVESPAEPVVGRWDAGRLEQVLQNLLTNAIKYSPDGGEILIRVEARDEAVRISVIDHGLGIAPEARPHVFESLFRAQEASVSGIPGLGLGLSLVRTLVEAHGGQVAVDSELGRGSTFVVTLPYQVKPAVAITRNGNGHSADAAAMKRRPGP